MLNRLNLKINPNNQVVMTVGNYQSAKGQPHYLPLDREKEWRPLRIKEKLSRSLNNIRMARAAKFDWRGNPLPPKEKPETRTLDIIGKSQRGFKSCRLNRPKSFTAASGQKIRECGAAIDRISADPALTRAITLTLPADHVEAFRAIAAYSGYVINRLFQPIRRNHAKECHWFFVWEYQKRGALHLHIALYHPCATTGKILGDECIYQWLKILSDIEKKAQTDMFCQKDMVSYTPREKYQNQNQPMRRSLGAYFSKYAGKTESKNSKHCIEYPVSRFWGSSYSVKELIKQQSYDYTLAADDEATIQEMSEKIVSMLIKFDMNISSSYDFDIRKTYVNGFELTVANGTRMTFYCHPKQYLTLLELLKTQTMEF
jgi:hypothetical protein